MRYKTTHPTREDNGFTLIEVLMVTVILGLIMGAIAASFTVIARTTPDTEIRVNDARSTRGLATWLSHDTTSTPRVQTAATADGFDVSAGANLCGASGSNVLHLRWSEDGLTSRTYIANYRFVPNGDNSRIVRFTCSKSATGSFAGTSSINLTSGLDSTQPPVVTFETDVVDGGVNSVTIKLTAVSGEQVLIETGPRNPTESF